MDKKIVLFLVAVLLIFSSLISSSSFRQDNSLTIILVRHAEKVINDSTNPPLTEEGKARAAELAGILKYVPLDAVFSTPYTRTKETVLPASEDKGIKIEYYNAGSEKSLLEKIFERFDGKNGIILIAGHSNTIHLFLNLLVGEELYNPIEDNIYDNLYIATTFAPGKAMVLHMRYGKLFP